LKLINLTKNHHGAIAWRFKPKPFEKENEMKELSKIFKDERHVCPAGGTYGRDWRKYPRCNTCGAYHDCNRKFCRIALEKKDKGERK
jgi:hypothetical protein